MVRVYLRIPTNSYDKLNQTIESLIIRRFQHTRKVSEATAKCIYNVFKPKSRSPPSFALDKRLLAPFNPAANASIPPSIHPSILSTPNACNVQSTAPFNPAAYPGSVFKNLSLRLSPSFPQTFTLTHLPISEPTCAPHPPTSLPPDTQAAL